MGNSPSTIPDNSQLNHIKLTPENPNCSTANFFDLSATVPLYGGANQIITLSDLRGSLDFPPFNVDFDWDIAWNVTFDLVSDNAQPSIVHIAHSGYQSVNNGSWAFTNEPIALTLGPSGQNNIRIANVNGSLDFYSYGTFEFHSAGNCIGPDSKNIFTSIAIAPDANNAAAPSNNGTSRLPTLEPGSKYTAAQLYTVCNIQGYDGPLFYQALQYNAIVPNNVSAVQPVNLSSFDTFITVPGYVVKDYSTYYAQDDYAYIEVQLGVNFDGSPYDGTALGLSTASGSPSILDVQNNFVDVGTTTEKPLGVIRTVAKGYAEDLAMPIPVQGSFDVTGFTAGTSGSVFSINGTSFVGILTGYGVGGNLIRRRSFVCSAGFETIPFSIFSIPVV